MFVKHLHTRPWSSSSIKLEKKNSSLSCLLDTLASLYCPLVHAQHKTALLIMEVKPAIQLITSPSLSIRMLMNESVGETKN